jgi:type II secretory pathway component GspD/PulD (secretin)
MRAKIVGQLIVLSVIASLASATTAPPCGSDRAVTLHAVDQDVQTVLRNVAQQSKLNIAISPSLHAVVSVDFNCVEPRRVVRQISKAIGARYCVADSMIFVLPKRATCPRYEPAYVPVASSQSVSASQ